MDSLHDHCTRELTVGEDLHNIGIICVLPFIEGGLKSFLSHRCVSALNSAGKLSFSLTFKPFINCYVQGNEPQFIFMKANKNKLTLLSKKKKIQLEEYHRKKEL